MSWQETQAWNKGLHHPHIELKLTSQDTQGHRGKFLGLERNK